MITIAKAVQDIVATSPYLEEAMGKGIINLSALARLVRPQIQKRLYKQHISQAALVMALRRLQPKIKQKIRISKLFSQMQNLTVRSNLVEITINNSVELDRLRREVMQGILTKKDAFFSLIQGVRESTLVMSKSLEPLVNRSLTNKIVSKMDNLASITIGLPPENRKTPGVYYALLKVLAWHDINLVEIISNYNEVTLVFADKDIEQAFSLIKNLSTPN